MSVNPLAFAERTALAWNRSGLALAVVGALAFRAGQRGGLVALGEALAALLWASAAAAWLYGSSLYRRRAEGTENPPIAERERALGLLTVTTVVVSAAALVLALVD